MTENLRICYVVLFRALWCVLLWLAVSPGVVQVLLLWGRGR